MRLALRILVCNMLTGLWGCAAPVLEAAPIAKGVPSIEDTPVDGPDSILAALCRFLGLEPLECLNELLSAVNGGTLPF